MQHINGPVSVAQWIARRTSNPEVVGSSPIGDATFSAKKGAEKIKAATFSFMKGKYEVSVLQGIQV